MNGLRRAALYATRPLRRRVLARRIRRLVLERWDGLDLVVLPEVLNPVVFRTGVVLAEAVAHRIASSGRALRVLDLGCGAGLAGLAAARGGAAVVATDLNSAAVRCARLNALLNRLETRIDVREGDLFVPVAGERFDLVAFNPPFFPGTPLDAYDLAWRSPDAWERFCSGLPAVLSPGGKALALLSDHADLGGMTGQALAAGCAIEKQDEVDLGDERIFLLTLRTQG